MLTADLVRTRIKAGKLTLLGVNPKARARILKASSHLLELTQAACADRATREDYLNACEEVEIAPSDRRVMEGVRKLILDRCAFEAAVEDPAALRARLFLRAAEVRRLLPANVPFNRDEIVADVASEVEMTPAALEAALYADLKQNHYLTRFDPIQPEALIDLYHLSLQQAALLKAVKVIVHVECADPGALRQIFRALKFRRLLYRATREGELSSPLSEPAAPFAHAPPPRRGGVPRGEGYLLEIDGPHSLFQQVTKYGLQLALFFPTLALCSRWALKADIRWGKQKRPVTLELEGGNASLEMEPPRLPDEVEQLVERFKKLKSEWKVQRSSRLLDLPGVGICVPDLVFARVDAEGKKTQVYLEVLGYWSREAVWRRVDLINKGLSVPTIFAVGSRLRVDEKVVKEETIGELYVYRGVIQAKEILRRLEKYVEG